jgi:endonuclease G
MKHAILSSKLATALAATALAFLLIPNPASAAGVCKGWTAGPANNLDNCRPLWEAIGEPSYSSDVDATPVCHTAYVLSHNNARKTPDWVIEHVTQAQAKGTNKRPDVGFEPETNVCEAARAIDDDYTNSKLDRGHQAPSNDFKSSRKLMAESFILSNVVPQVGLGFNRGIWKDFEALVRDLAIDRGEIYVITGPIYPDAHGKIPPIKAGMNGCRKAISFQPPIKNEICDANNKNPKVDCEKGVAVPVGLYKIIYDPAMMRANAYILPNIDHRPLETDSDPLEYLKRFRVSLKVVERYTGIGFLTALPSRTHKIQADSCPATMLH